jgi:RsiW-degrading membrane proteinase PrsW (M82 family)
MIGSFIECGEGKAMKYLISMYVVMAIIVFVNLISEFILNGAYSAIASWLIVMLFLVGTMLFANARYDLTKKSRK